MNIYKSFSGTELALENNMKALITSICFLFFIFTVLSALLAFTTFGAQTFQFLQMIFGISLIGFILSLLYLFNSSISDKINFDDDHHVDS